MWGTSLTNELGRLAQGIGTITVNNVVYFIVFEDVHSHKTVIYE